MSVEVHQYLDNSGGNNFTETATRPPVGPGEENELHSNSGNSNRSSGSHKSQTSNRSTGSANGGATPRRLQKTAKLPPTSSGPAVLSATVSSGEATGPPVNNEETEAPLGFEPEGSVDHRLGFTESGSPAYTKWNESLEYLLEDPDGVDLFKSYLIQENSVNLFEFYFAWKCLQNLDTESDASGINALIRSMYKAYFKGEKKLPFITNEIKERTSKLVSSKQDPKLIFNSIKDQVLDILNREFYVPFFKSDIYQQYIQAIESPKDMTAHSSGSVSAQPVNMILPTVHEDSELDLNQPSAGSISEPPVTLTLTMKNMKITERLRMESKIKPEEQAGYYLQKSHDEGSLPPHPYHTCSTSYLPISAIDSERQSLSSEALTDDTHSITDSSVDGFPQFTNKKSIQRYYKRIKASAQRNPETSAAANQHLLPPKDHRLSKASNLAETKPMEFAEILSEKLQRVLDEQNRKEMVRSKLSAMSEDEGTDDSHSILSSTTGGVGSTNTTLNQLMVAIQASDHDPEAQDILDMHCKRIWEKSGQHSPAKSPRSKSPDHLLQHTVAQSKRVHTVCRQNMPINVPSTSRPIPTLPYPKTNMLYPMDNSYPQPTISMPYTKSNSRHGMATFSSRAEQQSIFKFPSHSASINNQKVVEWISRNEEIMQLSNLHGPPESEKSSVRKSQRSANSAASPRVSRNKTHAKGVLPSEPKRSLQDDKHSTKSKSTSSSGNKRTSLSRSAGEASSQQTLTQRKGVREPPQIKVAFFLLDEPIPYSTTVPGTEITLAKFKELITKKGNYRYFFKKATNDEFGDEVPYVLEEITNDNAILPKWESKVVGHIKKVE